MLASILRLKRWLFYRFYKTFKERIADLFEAESLFSNGEVELDESYFGGRRVCGLRGRGEKGIFLFWVP